MGQAILKKTTVNSIGPRKTCQTKIEMFPSGVSLKF